MSTLPAFVFAFTAVLATGFGVGAWGRWRVRRRLELRGQAGSPPRRAMSARRSRLVARIEPSLEAADVVADADRVLGAWRLLLVVAAVVGLLFGGPALAVLAVLAIGIGPALLLRLARHRRRRRIEASLPAVLESLASALRGGRTLAQAVVEVGEATDGSGEAITSLASAVAAGDPVAEAVDRWQRRSSGSAAELVAAALGLAAHAGGSAARAVDGVAATLRERRDADAEANALAAQARLSAGVIVVAPLVFAALAAMADPRTLEFLLGSPVGLGCLLLGVGLDVAAAVWMRRIVASEPW